MHALQEFLWFEANEKILNKRILNLKSQLEQVANKPANTLSEALEQIIWENYYKLLNTGKSKSESRDEIVRIYGRNIDEHDIDFNKFDKKYFGGLMQSAKNEQENI